MRDRQLNIHYKNTYFKRDILVQRRTKMLNILGQFAFQSYLFEVLLFSEVHLNFHITLYAGHIHKLKLIEKDCDAVYALSGNHPLELQKKIKNLLPLPLKSRMIQPANTE